MKTGYPMGLRRYLAKAFARSQDSAQPSLSVSASSETALGPEIPPPAPRPRFRGWPWLLPLLISTTTGLAATVWILTLPPVPDCKNLAPVASDAERLYCADQEARQGNLGALLSALAMAGNWPKDHPLYSQANQLAAEWSLSVLLVARQKQDQGDLQQALALVRKIPASVPAYEEAQQLIAAWEIDTDKGKALFQQVQTAIKDQRLDEAAELVKELSQLDSDYWQRQAQEFTAKITAERQAGDRLVEAENLATSGISDDLAQAIRLAGQIDPTSAYYQKAQDQIGQWSQSLLAQVESEQETGNPERAMTLLQELFSTTAGSDPNPGIAQLAKAQTAARDRSFWAYLEAWALASQVPSDSSLHKLALIQTKSWESKIQSLGQLQVGQWLAATRQSLGYQLAVQQVSLIAQQQPQFQQAQELLGQWRQQISRLQDQPWLAAANILAQQRQFQRAIQVAQLISPERALYNEAQQSIQNWQGEIEGVVDRPLLNRAIAEAQAGNLTTAIATANEITPGRILYLEAQKWIGEWLRERDALEAAKRQPTPPNPEATEPEPPESTATDFSPIPSQETVPSPEETLPAFIPTNPAPAPTTVSPAPAPEAVEPPPIDSFTLPNPDPGPPAATP